MKRWQDEPDVQNWVNVVKVAGIPDIMPALEGAVTAYRRCLVEGLDELRIPPGGYDLGGFDQGWSGALEEAVKLTDSA